MIHTMPTGTRVEILVKDSEARQRQVFYAEVYINRSRGYIIRNSTEELIKFLEHLEKSVKNLKFKT